MAGLGDQSALMLSSVAGELTTPWLAATVRAPSRCSRSACCSSGRRHSSLVVVRRPCRDRGRVPRARAGLRDHRCRRWCDDRIAHPAGTDGERGWRSPVSLPGVPAMVALPLGLMLAGRIGYRAGLRHRRSGRHRCGGGHSRPSQWHRHDREAADQRVVKSALRSGALMRPSLVFMTTAMAAGYCGDVPSTCGRRMASRSARRHSCCWCNPPRRRLARVGAGRYGDRHGAGRSRRPRRRWPRGLGVLDAWR